MKVDGEPRGDTELRVSKKLSAMIERRHRGVNLMFGPVQGFRPFRWVVSFRTCITHLYCMRYLDFRARTTQFSHQAISG